MSELITQIEEQLGSDVIIEATDSTQAPQVEGKPLTQAEIQKIMKKAAKDRYEQVKANKAMIEEMKLEVDYWKAQADLLRYRFEKMDFYLKNIELEPKYLAAVETLRLKEERDNPPQTNSSIISL